MSIYRVKVEKGMNIKCEILGLVGVKEIDLLGVREERA